MKPEDKSFITAIINMLKDIKENRNMMENNRRYKAETSRSSRAEKTLYLKQKMFQMAIRED